MPRYGSVIREGGMDFGGQPTLCHRARVQEASSAEGCVCGELLTRTWTSHCVSSGELHHDWLNCLTPCTSVSLAGRKNLGLMNSKVPSSAGKPCLTCYLKGSLSLLSISSLCISWQATLAILLGAFISSHETMIFVRGQVYLSVPIALCRYQKIKKYFWIGWLVVW